MKQQPDPRYVAEQARQRVKVGMIGLAAVVLLIGLASAIFSTVTRDHPALPASVARGEAVAHAGSPGTSTASGNEPLAELGVAPSIANSTAPADER
jgi:hypothetical protein